MNQENHKIADLDIDDNEKKALTLLSSPKNIAEVAVILDVSYTTSSQKLQIWLVKKWVKRTVANRRTYYELNTEVLNI